METNLNNFDLHFYIYQEKSSSLRHTNCLSAQRRSEKEETQILPVPCNNMLPSLCSPFSDISPLEIMAKGMFINDIYNVINTKVHLTSS